VRVLGDDLVDRVVLAGTAAMIAVVYSSRSLTRRSLLSLRR
jgi:hypothetical protein